MSANTPNTNPANTPATEPFVLRVEAAVTIEQLVYAETQEDAHNLLHGELGEQLQNRIRSFFKHPDSPFVVYEHGDRPALWVDVHGSADPAAYPPLIPGNATLIRDPDDEAFDITADDVPDHIPDYFEHGPNA